MSQAIPETELSPQHPPTIPNPDPDQDTSPSQLEEHLPPVPPRRQGFILLSSFLTICITIGFNQSYGVFQSYYVSDTQTLLPPEAQSQGAWIAFVGTLGAGLTWGGSIVVNPLMARVKDVRLLTVTGVVCMSAGFGGASFASQVGGSLCHISPYISLPKFPN
jgi:hypothetical protein